jgi:hypothetical protein
MDAPLRPLRLCVENLSRGQFSPGFDIDNVPETPQPTSLRCSHA